MRRRDISKVLFASAAGTALVAERASAQTCVAPCYPRTAAEISANVTPTDYSYEATPIDPRRYGLSTSAVATTNTPALNNAIKVSQHGGGAILIRQPGIYTCHTLVMKPGVTLHGSGWGTILKLADGFNSHLISWDEINPCDDCEIAHLQLDGNKANAPDAAAGIVLVGQRMRIRDVYVHDTVTANILIQGTASVLSEDCLVESCQCMNPGHDGNNWGAIAGTKVRRFRVRNNLIVGNDGEMTYAIDVEPDPGEFADQVFIEDNVAIGGRIFVDGANSTAISRIVGVKVTGNYVDARNSHGIGQANGAPLFLRYAQTIDVSGNTLIGANGPYGGIYIDGCNDFSIKANTFVCTDIAGDEYAIFFADDITDNSRGDIAGNTFLNTGPGTYRYAVHALATDVAQLVIGHNTMLGSWSSEAYNATGTEATVTPGVWTTRRITVNFSTGGSLASGASRSVTVSSGFSASPGDVAIASVVSGTIGTNSFDLLCTTTNVNTVCLTLWNRDASAINPGSSIDIRLTILRYRIAGAVH
jgi:hypothetical protein